MVLPMVLPVFSGKKHARIATARISKYPYYLWHGQCQAYFMEENAKLLYAEIYLNENERDCSKQFIKIRYITENGDRFEGHGTNCTKSVPHGEGKWTFLNGDTFSGDNVAFDGIPHGTGMDGTVYFAGKRVK
ncbi:unnamed protein product [marine sediment metagenome]|uniref:Uncharacterized protein n=1 Tax=marine sediment metagenome TaxID=412755 RepID=X1D632_9ZZZZ